MQNTQQSNDYPNNSEFNKAMLDIIKHCLGDEELYTELKDMELVNLPTNFSVVDDFCAEVYKIRGCHKSHTKH